MKNKGGRPLKINDLVLHKLEEAFALGSSDTEACFYAGISGQCLYDYQKKNPEFLERKVALKESPILKARKAVVEAFEDSPDLALKFLERRKRDEFSPKHELQHSGELHIPKPNKDYSKLTNEELDTLIKLQMKTDPNYEENQAAIEKMTDAELLDALAEQANENMRKNSRR